MLSQSVTLENTEIIFFRQYLYPLLDWYVTVVCSSRVFAGTDLVNVAFLQALLTFLWFFIL